MRLALPFFIVVSCGPAKQLGVESAPVEAAVTYPEARRTNVVDTFHGDIDIADPYRWLEDPDSEETQDWVASQNQLTRSWLDDMEGAEAVRQRLEGLVRYERFGVPKKHNDKYFFSYNDGNSDQASLYLSATPTTDGEPRLLLDASTLSEDGTTSLSGWKVNKDATKLVFSTSEGGSDWRTLRVLDIAAGAILDDEVKWAKFSDLTWQPDGDGFFYTRYAEPENPLEQVNYDQQLYFHKVGTEQADDVLVYERPDNPEMGFGTEVTHDGELLIIAVWQGTEEKTRLYYKTLGTDGPEVRLLDDFDANYRLVGKTQRKLLIHTDLDAPKERVVAIDLDAPDRENWTEVIAESDHKLQSVQHIGGRLVATYLEDAKSVVRLFELDGTSIGPVELPGIGSVEGMSGNPDSNEAYYQFESLTRPETIVALDVSTGVSTITSTPEVPFEPSDFVVDQVFYESKDGTRIPMFIARRTDVEKTGTLPTLLYGYGGFNIPIPSSYKPWRMAWMQMGGVWASANLRGGGEYGRDWHEAGTKTQKQNVFDDFIAGAEFLVADGWTTSERLAIHGRSNGGLLAAATVVQRPDLFGASIPTVGVLDMTRYHKFTIGWAWASDYGTVDDSPEMAKALLAYSPYHNTKAGVRYPPVMITTADHDDRVVPAHSFKFAAALQHAAAERTTIDNPALIRISTKAGHGAGTSLSMQVDEATDKIIFLKRALRVED
jgi:prolyl oligopeptidase